MNGTIYEEATWYDIENNKMHLKKDGEHYVADATLFRDNLNLRQENESLKKENDGLRKEINSTERLQAENAKLKRKLEILKDYGIEIVDAVAGGFEIYNEEHARADRLQAENEKLREELAKWERLAAGIDLPEYPVTQFKPKDLERENAKLRELAEVLVNCGRKYHTMSGSCPMFDASAEGDDFCGAVRVARELGIEV